MRAQQGNKILSGAFFDSLVDSTKPVNEACMLPPSCYVDAEFYQFEKEAIFLREWLCVGRESALPEPGSYLVMFHAGEPILVVRNKEGAIKAMSAVCQHRGMLVAEGSGSTRIFRCPYHHWSYDWDGHLRGCPNMDRAVNFSRGDIRLPQFQVETWMGFIFVNMDPTAPPLSPRLAALSEAAVHHDLATARGPKPDHYSKLPWNWKVMFENTNDGYHANRLHKGPIHDVCPSSLSQFPELPEDTAGYFRINGLTHIDAGFNPTLKAIMPVFPQLTDAERSRVIFANIPPSLWVSLRPDQSSYFIIRADGPEETSIEQGVLFAPGAMDEPLFNERLAMAAQSGAVFAAQDRHVDTQVQRGMRSHFAPRGRYSWQEQTLLEFNQWLVKRYHAQRSRTNRTAH